VIGRADRRRDRAPPRDEAHLQRNHDVRCERCDEGIADWGPASFTPSGDTRRKVQRASFRDDVTLTAGRSATTARRDHHQHTVSELPSEFRIIPTDAALVVSGEIDVHTAPELREAADAVLARRSAIRLDMSGVGFIDSSGLGALVSITEAAREAGGDLVVVAPSRAVVRLLELSGLTEHIHVDDNG
jgi:anti-sigma B factor antagonist